MGFETIFSAVAPTIIGGLLGGSEGGSSQGGTQTQTREPWAEAAPWLKQQLQTGQQMQDYYQRNPFNSQQQAAYGNLAAGTNYMNQLVPGLLGQLSNQPAFDRNNPTGRQSSVSFASPSTGQFGFGAQASGFQGDMNTASNPFANGGIVAPAPASAPAPVDDEVGRAMAYYRQKMQNDSVSGGR